VNKLKTEFILSKHKTIVVITNNLSLCCKWKGATWLDKHTFKNYW